MDSESEITFVNHMADSEGNMSLSEIYLTKLLWYKFKLTHYELKKQCSWIATIQNWNKNDIFQNKIYCCNFKGDEESQNGKVKTLSFTDALPTWLEHDIPTVLEHSRQICVIITLWKGQRGRLT